MDKPGAGHRFDHRADRLSVDLLDPAGKSSKRVDVGRNGELIEVPPPIAQKADVDLPTTEIQSGVQH